jgi:hypothetical protein
MHRWFTYCLATILAVVGANHHAFAQTKTAPAKRRVFVLHSGMHIILAPKDKNHAARTLKQLLKARGVPEADLVALESPFPTATWSDMVPREGLLLYLDSADPASRRSQDAYVRLHQALQDHHVTRADDIVWVGHSAGGQIGMTMAHLAHNLGKYPELAKKTKPYHFDTVITLGSAVGSNPVPAEVKLRHYYSAGDTMIYALTKHGNVVAESMNSKVCFGPSCELGANAKMRVFHGIEHAYWYTNAPVLERILNEFDPAFRPVWRRSHAETGCGFGLGQLMANVLDSELNISLEEPRH